MKVNKLDSEIIRIALNYLDANVDDVEEALETTINQKRLAELIYRFENNASEPLKKQNVEKAIRMIVNPMGYANCLLIEKEIALVLEKYEDRGEWNGSYNSAVECLILEGYEVENESH